MTATDPILGRYLGGRDTGDTTPTRGASLGWREELVELRVLAEHGDRAAAARLRDWVASDSAARAVHNSIASDIEVLRTGSSTWSASASMTAATSAARA